MRLLRLLVLMLCGTAAAPLSAADTWYEVELIVVAQRNPDAGSEIWPAHQPLPAGMDTALPVPLAGQASTDPRLAPLPPENYRLLAEAERIATDANYELLLHTGWRQAGLAREQSIPLRLYAVTTDVAAATEDTVVDSVAPAGDVQAATENVRPRLDGTLRLILARYLHLETDLQYRAAGDATPPADNGFFSLSDAAPAEQPVYRMNESRRMRSREVHYLDHPMFGVIALVTPYEPPAPAIAPVPAAKPAAAPATAPAGGATGTIKRN
ncbi:MAG: hypothetical protein CVV05_07915 [Gammaproteobacteria bacterium HGW-Gammaproteobacteria-1]|jgi:hypothetical protein|nr:MAG: hypothetical protein CVV05_07915 [Gammaproteobacteria bacterium HGW-Gammaproteobacteria-1]